MKQLVAILATVATAGVSACGQQPSATPSDEPVILAGRWEPTPRVPKRVDGYQGLSAFALDGTVTILAQSSYDQATVQALNYDTADDHWSVGTDSAIWWRYGAASVATDDEIILHGGCCGPAGSGSRAAGFAYDVRRDRWRRIKEGPLGSRFDHTAMWTGSEAIVWGGLGSAERSEGAIYDPVADVWRRVAPSPLAPRREHVAVWTGKEMLVWGGVSDGLRRAARFRDGAAYDPAADRWRRITPAPISPQLSAEPERDATEAVWTGRRMLVWNGRRGAAYDPVADSWARIPPSPLGARDRSGTDSVVWTGEEMIVWGGAVGGTRFLATGAAYDPEMDRWRSLPESPVAGRDRHAAVWTGDAMLIWGGCCRGTRYLSNGALFVPE